MRYLPIFLLLFSCQKQNIGILAEPTALNFTSQTKGNATFKYKYTLLKYNNSWHVKTIDGKKYEYTDLLTFEVYSNKSRPINKWIRYVDWMRDTTIITFSNQSIDSFASMGKIEISETELNKLTLLNN